MAVCLVISFIIGKITRSVIKSLIEKQEQRRNMYVSNPRGGSLNSEISDNTEIEGIILACISGDESYLVKDTITILTIFNLVKAKINQEFFILTSNMMRFLALSLLNKKQTFIIKIGNIVTSSNNRIRFFNRVIKATAIDFVGGILSTFSYSVLLTIISFSQW
jgi:hypothetical protein